VDAGDGLGQDRLPGAVVSAESRDLTGRKIQIDVVESLDSAEVFADAAQAQQDLPAPWVFRHALASWCRASGPIQLDDRHALTPICARSGPAR
jgi:hypothetical protein